MAATDRRCEHCPIAEGRACPAITRQHSDLCEGMAIAPDRWRPVVEGLADLDERAARRTAILARSPRIEAGRLVPATIGPDEWVPTARLVELTLGLIKALPPEIEAVAGIARSGLIPAAVLAAHLHLPLWSLSTPDQTITPVGAGQRMAGPSTDPQCLLIVDDTVARGQSMDAAFDLVATRWPAVRIVRAAVITGGGADGAVDLRAAIAAGHHFLEWNLFNTGAPLRIAYDFDGVLCEDQPEQGYIDSHLEAVRNARPFYLPRRRPIPLIITWRPESQRALSEAWLTRWGVTYERMEMHGPHSTPFVKDRDMREQIGEWKGRIYKSSDCELYVESDPLQAPHIARASGKPVLCPALGKVLGPPVVEPPLPSRLRQVTGFVQTAVAVAMGGFRRTAPERKESRLGVCRLGKGLRPDQVANGHCHHYRPSDGRCGKMDGCGCYVAEKAEYEDADCPEGYWDR